MGPLVLLFSTLCDVCPGFQTKVNPSVVYSIVHVQCIPHIYLWCNILLVGN